MQHPEQHLDSLFGGPIHVYTRAQAISNGNLIDVSDTAREAGFHIPVALTAAAWSDCVAWSNEDSQRQVQQDEAGRLWDVLWTASLAARRGYQRTDCFVSAASRTARRARCPAATHNAAPDRWSR